MLHWEPARTLNATDTQRVADAQTARADAFTAIAAKCTVAGNTTGRAAHVALAQEIEALAKSIRCQQNFGE